MCSTSTGQSFDDYRRATRDQYDGLAGAFTGITGILTGHATLAARLFRPGAFDVRGCKRILDAACGDGRYSRFLLQRADADAVLTSFDLSPAMLRRAQTRLGTDRVTHTVADLTRLPYATGCFDAIVCGWVLEHLPDPRLGLRELARILAPGGKLLVLTTESNWLGQICARLWSCRTYTREELRRAALECDLNESRELWFSRLHQSLRMGGIIMEFSRSEARRG